jgi:chromosome segregation ATPase
MRACAGRQFDVTSSRRCLLGLDPVGRRKADRDVRRWLGESRTRVIELEDQLDEARDQLRQARAELRRYDDLVPLLRTIITMLHAELDRRFREATNRI